MPANCGFTIRFVFAASLRNACALAVTPMFVTASFVPNPKKMLFAMSSLPEAICVVELASMLRPRRAKSPKMPLKKLGEANSRMTKAVPACWPFTAPEPRIVAFQTFHSEVGCTPVTGASPSISKPPSLAPCSWMPNQNWFVPR